ncbi:MAG: hypothetical protein IT535_13340 [Bauldia sp.]|nr:hypothetical protein [Bauldia sp.]
MRLLAALLLALAPALAAAQPRPPSAAEVEADELAAALQMLEALDAACADPDSTACAIARLNAVSPLSVALVQLGESGAHDADAPRIRPFAAANHPRLRWAAAVALGAIRPTAEDTETLLVLLNDFVPAVRAAARASLNASEDPRAVGIAGAALPSNDEAWRPETFPDPGVALPESATFLRFFSDRATGALVFSAEGSPAEAIAWFERLTGNTAATPDAFRTAYPVAFGGGSAENPMQRLVELGERMATMTFPEQIAAMAELAELQQQVSAYTPEQMMAALAPADELPGNIALEPWLAPARFADPMILTLEESEDGTLPRRIAIVYNDVLLGRTGFALQPIPAAPRQTPAAATTTPEPLSREALLDEAFWTTVTGGASAARYLELFPEGRHRAEAERLVAALPGPVADLPAPSLLPTAPVDPAAPAVIAPGPAPAIATPAPEDRGQRRR